MIGSGEVRRSCCSKGATGLTTEPDGGIETLRLLLELHESRLVRPREVLQVLHTWGLAVSYLGAKPSPP